ncbi:MAG: hypothetical protein WB869_07395 [Candidatus Acidiferrales bacterium]
MFSRPLHRYVLAVSVILVLAIAAFAQPAAQPQQAAPAKQPTAYTYIAFFGVPRANWAEYEKGLEKGSKVMAAQVANGNLVSWGDGALEVHEGLNAPTHVSWMSSMTVSGLLKAEAAEMASAPVTSSINYTTHFDEISMSSNYGGKADAAAPKYLLAQDWKVKPGRSGDFTELFNKYRKADLDAAVADGSLTSYSLEEDLIHTSAPGNYTIVVTFPSAEAVDKFYDSLQAQLAKNPLFGEAFGSVVEMPEHRDHLLRVLDSGHK